MVGAGVLVESYPTDLMLVDDVKSEEEVSSMSRRSSKRKTSSSFNAHIDYEQDSDSDYSPQRTPRERNPSAVSANQVSSRDEEEYLASILLMIKTCDSLPAIVVTQEFPTERLELVSRVHLSLANASAPKTSPNKRNKKSQSDDSSTDRSSREERSSRKELSRFAQAIGGAGYITPNDGSEVESPAAVSRSSRGASGQSSKDAQKKGKGRRFMRFACDKHRREHVKCPDNCPLRKQNREEYNHSESSDDSRRNFLQSSENFEDDNNAGDDVFC